MSATNIINMTPGSEADCFLPGCMGVSGGVCAGTTSQALNTTLWWCCTPYAPKCRGGAQFQCNITKNVLSPTQIQCQIGNAEYKWCCSSEYEECPPQTGLEGSCIPKNFTNPAANGPIWGPDAVNLNSTTSITSSATSSTTSSATSSATSPTRTPPSQTALPAGDGGGERPLSLGAAGAIGAVVVLVLVALLFGLWYMCFRKRRPEATQVAPPYMYEEGMGQQPVYMHEVAGDGMTHELETEARKRESEYAMQREGRGEIALRGRKRMERVEEGIPREDERLGNSF